MKKKLFGLFICLQLSAPLAVAENLTFGVGAASCKTYLEFRESSHREAANVRFMAWTQGFISGINNMLYAQKSAGFTPLAAPTDNSYLDALDSVCRDSPDSLILNAVLHLMRKSQG